MKKYTVKLNKDTQKYDVSFKSISFNMHSSIAPEMSAKVSAVLEREFLRFDYQSAYVKMMSENDDKSRAIVNAIESETKMTTIDLKAATSLSEIPTELRMVVFATIYVHGKYTTGITEKTDENGTHYSFVSPAKDFHGAKLRSECIKAVSKLENDSNATLENLIKSIKPSYSEMVKQFDTDAVEGVCKNWKESTRNVDVKKFLLGLTETYKLSKSNLMERKTPLASDYEFDKYVLMWVVSGGKFKTNKKTVESVESIESLLARM